MTTTPALLFGDYRPHKHHVVLGSDCEANALCVHCGYQVAYETVSAGGDQGWQASEQGWSLVFNHRGWEEPYPGVPVPGWVTRDAAAHAAWQPGGGEWERTLCAFLAGEIYDPTREVGPGHDTIRDAPWTLPRRLLLDVTHPRQVTALSDAAANLLVAALVESADRLIALACRSSGLHANRVVGARGSVGVSTTGSRLAPMTASEAVPLLAGVAAVVRDVRPMGEDAVAVALPLCSTVPPLELAQVVAGILA